MSAVSRNETSREQIPRRLKFITPKHSLSEWSAAHRVKPESKREKINAAASERACMFGEASSFQHSSPISRLTANKYVPTRNCDYRELGKMRTSLSPLWPVRFFLWRGAEVKSDYGPRPAEKLCGPSQSTRKKTCQTTPNARRAVQQYELSSAIPLLAFHQTWETAERRRQFLPAR